MRTAANRTRDAVKRVRSKYKSNTYDLLNKVYVDYKIDNGAHMKELDALYEMAGRIPDPEHTILTADRGYGYFNAFSGQQREIANQMYILSRKVTE